MYNIYSKSLLFTSISYFQEKLKFCNNINNSCVQVSRLCYFLWLWFKDLKLLQLHDVLESEIRKNFSKFSRNELPKSVCSKFNLVHEVHTRNTRNKLLIYILRMSISRHQSLFARWWYFFKNKFFKDFFQTMIWLCSLNWSHFLWNDSYKLTKMSCKLLTHVQTISSQFFPLNVLLWNVVQLLNRLI